MKIARSMRFSTRFCASRVSVGLAAVAVSWVVAVTGAHAQTAATSGTPTKPAAAVAQAAPQVTSQITSQAPSLPVIEGKTIEGAPFKLESLKGKVVLVMFWSTNCAVCRDKMPELRSNYVGWMGKPFELVAVNTDSRVQDFLDYERIISATVPLKQRFVQLWTGETNYKDNIGKHAQLPSALLIDKSGKVVKRYVGRIPPEAWDSIAELL